MKTVNVNYLCHSKASLLLVGLVTIFSSVQADTANQTPPAEQPYLATSHSLETSQYDTAKTLFQQGRYYQKLALSESTTSEEKQRLLHKSLEIYRQAQELTQSNTAILNNLGQTLTALGKYDQAESIFLEALDDDSNKVAMVAFNYSSLLIQQGRKDDAIEYARLASNIQPDSLKIHRHALSLLSKHEPKALPGYLRNRLKKGHEKQVIRESVNALESRYDKVGTQYELLRLVALGIIRTPGNPFEFINTTEFPKLKEIAKNNRKIKRGIEELLSLVKGDLSSPLPGGKVGVST